MDGGEALQLNEEVPAALRGPAEAAVAWINAERGLQFKLSGVLAEDEVLLSPAREDFELGLILCDGEICAREQVRIEGRPNEYRFAFVEGEAGAIPAALDPPVGVRQTWLTEQFEQHEFLLLLYYRGRW